MMIDADIVLDRLISLSCHKPQMTILAGTGWGSLSRMVGSWNSSVMQTSTAAARLQCSCGGDYWKFYICEDDAQC
ncbi:uncharacterized protein MYCFIDRAFT_208858 [Pseudocercospora fijiensis CIRAD86]|uniref:Uncharacterized protein n=1 Tax=Pseudocercospora fijiensis (strain CIRAD86) TaxID=383855 RepID=M2ZKP8_PSEFD|nr:uncharacterized protein MYCFIDRAFT_208858 [Pseudocercospora fijiensis CIRAD86]EME79649.1 hypothetical protein MYCFIDRAFT_208858 [Pseudocercospora fijiensis CIRAD86]